MADFRMVPKQDPTPTKAGCVVRYGFMITGHPLGDPNNDGKYILSWSSYDTAVAAAYCLGMTEVDVGDVHFLVPELELPLYG